MTKSELLQRIYSARAEWNALLARVDSRTLLEPRSAGEWSVKDVIAHITWSEREMVGLFGPRTMANASPFWALSRDERNAAVYEEYRGWDLGRVLADSRETFEKLREILEGMSEEDLHDPGRFEGMPPEWVPWEIIAQSTYEHYEDHTPDIARLVQQS